jgi:predicted regulator of Ras-like GTPase activity (Roadblock/LC7/MglB family)
MLNSAFTMDRAAHSAVSELCEGFIRRADATCALLVGQDGMLLHRCGAVADLDVDSLSALSAGAFASSREMAGLIGEANFDVAIQQGHRNHLQMIRVGDCAILVAVFDDRTTAAMVRLHGQRVARRLSAVLAEGEDGAGLAWTDTPGQEVEPATSLDGDGSGPTDFARQTQTRAEQLRAAFRMRTLSFVLALLAAAVAVLGGLWRH